MITRLATKRGAAVQCMILCGAFVIHAVLVQSGEDTAIRALIVLTPLPVAAFCFLTARHYGNSRIFGRSFFILGISYALVFSGEIIFFQLVDTMMLAEFSRVGEALFLMSYVLLSLHVIINIRYFAEKIHSYQKALIVTIPIIMIFAYSAMFFGASYEITGEFYYNLVFVAASSTVLAMTMVAFLVFWDTAMSPAWFALLAGIAIGTAGDLSYGYAYALGIYEFTDISGPLWNASHLIVSYALYMHQKNI